VIVLVPGGADLIAAALWSELLARIVKNQLPHHAGRQALQMEAIVDLLMSVLADLEKGFVDQGGGLQGVTGTQAAALGAADAFHVVVDQRHQPVEQFRRASDLVEQFSDFGRIQGLVSVFGHARRG
jgi:hypothetical protein